MTSVTAPKEVLPPKLMGKAIYLELVIDPTLSHDLQRRADWDYENKPTRQVIIFPSWTDDTGKTHGVRIMSRDVSVRRPRAQWDWSSPIRPIRPKPEPETPSYYSEEYVDFETISKEDQKLMPKEDLDKAYQLAGDVALRRLIVDTSYKYPTDPETGKDDLSKDRVQFAFPAWIVREGKPLAVEVTDEDLRQVLNTTTPQAVIRRINKVRSSLDNFPEKLG